MLELNLQAKEYNEIETLIGASLYALCKKAELVGSKAICSPPPQDSDTDILVYTPATEAFRMLLEVEGWKKDGNYPEGSFESYKKGDLNIILTFLFAYFHSFVRAKDVCKLLNLTDKAQRIAVHELMLKDFKVLEW